MYHVAIFRVNRLFDSISFFFWLESFLNPQPFPHIHLFLIYYGPDTYIILYKTCLDRKTVGRGVQKCRKNVMTTLVRIAGKSYHQKTSSVQSSLLE